MRMHLSLALTCFVCACSGASSGLGAADAGSLVDGPTTGDAADAGASADGGSPGMLTMDCTQSNPACPAMTMPPDQPDQSEFRGFADPSMRRDPASGRLWLSYSWPHDIVGDAAATKDTYVLDIHLSHSDDSGNTWVYDEPLWTAQPVTSASAGAGDGGLTYYSSHEVSNLAPIDDGSGNVSWVSIHKYYTVEAGQNPTSDWAQFTASNMFIVSAASTPTALDTAPTQRLGFAGTQAAVDFTLTSLSPDLAACALLDEPALMQQGSLLYLAAFCSSQHGNAPDYTNGFYAIFSTTPTGAPAGWTWKYEGKLSTPADAEQLDGHQIWWELDFTRKSDGTLLALVTPTDSTSGGLSNDGCRVLEVASLSPPAMAHDSAGNFIDLASITTSDLSGRSGGQACTYEPASQTGVVVFRYMSGSSEATGVLCTINATSLSP
jgi:hypothetical protein